MSCSPPAQALFEQALQGQRIDDEAARALAAIEQHDELIATAGTLRDRGHGDIITYSRKVFIPLTQLCRDVCHYCTFAKAPRRGMPAYLQLDQVLEIARRGVDAGCTEALFTLGDQPERRYRVAREGLGKLGQPSTLAYLEQAAAEVMKHTGLLPHVNPGVMSTTDLVRLRQVSVSMGLMLESTSERLCARGGPHFGSPDKHPTVRLQTLLAAGELKIPMTTGLLIGIGETRDERIESLLAIRALHERFGHIQEVIIQNFRAKPGTAMAGRMDAGEEDLIWTLAVARLLLGPAMNLQAPPNLAPGRLDRLIAAGINDWGGVSPITPDHVNPERPWPEVARLEALTRQAGKLLVPRLPVYPSYARQANDWVASACRPAMLRHCDAAGYAREDRWRSGDAGSSIPDWQAPVTLRANLDRLLGRTLSGRRPDERDIEALFALRGPAFADLCRAADELRRSTIGDTVTYVLNRNINYTNICTYHCGFCAFSKGRTSAGLRGPGYKLPLEEIVRRSQEAKQRGATEVCLQGGIHPSFTGETYLEILAAIKRAEPTLHVHAFSPLEILHGATSSGVSLDDYMRRLREAGLGSLPGTAAEILDNEVRQLICPDKLDREQWLTVMDVAHHAGLKSTATIMFGHVEQPHHWARHLLAIRDQQERSGGFTEFVPLPFVAQEAPIYLRGRARPGPTWREALAMHAVARLVLHPLIPNIQASWVKLGPAGVLACLQAGANDFGGTLMDESITRAAGASFGQELSPTDMAAKLQLIGRMPRQRTTLYAPLALEAISLAANPGVASSTFAIPAS
jgi:FO synthase